jgi:hypothetical protein
MSFTPRTELPGLEPEARRALVEVQTAIQRECKRLEERVEKPRRRCTELVEAGTVEAKPGEVVRVMPGDEDVTVLLPEPSSENDGQDIIVSFEGDGTATGKVNVTPKNGTCTKPGVVVLNAPGSYSFTSTGGGAVAKRANPAVPTGAGGSGAGVGGGSGSGWSGPSAVVTDDLPDDGVTNDKLDEMPANSVKVNATGAAANPTDLVIDPVSLLGRSNANVTDITAGATVDGQALYMRTNAAGDQIAWQTMSEASMPRITDGFFFANMSGVSPGQVLAKSLANMAGPGLTFSTANVGDYKFVVTGSTSIVIGTDAGTDDVQRAALTGDVTAAQNSNATTIANDAVTNAKLANMAEALVKGRALGAGTGDPTDLTGTQVAAILRWGNTHTAPGTGDLTDYTPAAGVDTIDTIFIDPGVDLLFNSLAAPTTAGKRIRIIKLANSNQVTIVDEALVGTAAQRFASIGNTTAPNIVLRQARSNVLVEYEGSRWRVIDWNPGIATTVNAGLVTPSTSLPMSGSEIQRAAITGFVDIAQNANAATSAEPIVTYSASANMSAERVTTSSTSITVSTAVASQIAFQRAALTGDVTAAADSNATTIAADAVTNAKLANMAAGTVKGLQIDAAGPADPVDLTGAEVGELLRFATTQDATITVQQDNFSLNADANVLRLTPTTVGVTVTGITGGSAGRLLLVENVASAGNTFIFASLSASSLAANRIRTPNAASLVLAFRESALLRWDVTNGDWRVVAVARAVGVNDADYGDVTVSGAGTVWTVDTNIVKTWTGAHAFTNATFDVSAVGDARIGATSGVGLFAVHTPAGVPTGAVCVNATAGISLVSDPTTPFLAPGAGFIYAYAPNDILVSTTAGGIELNTLAAHPASVSNGAILFTSVGLIHANAATSFVVTTGGTERLEIENDGAWQVGGSTGTSGHPLITAGSAASPAWGQLGTVGIADAAVTLAKQANLAQSTIIGRAEAAGTGVPQALTPTQVISIVDGESPTWTASHRFDSFIQFGTSTSLPATGDIRKTSTLVLTSADDINLIATDDVLVDANDLITVDAGGELALVAGNKLSVNSTNGIQIGSTTGMPGTGDIRKGSGATLLINSGADVDLVAADDVNITAADAVSIQGTGTTTVSGTTAVSITSSNNIGANAGGTVTLTSAGTATVSTGSGLVLVASAGILINPGSGSLVEISEGIRRTGVLLNSTNGTINDLAIGSAGTVRFSACDILTGMVPSTNWHEVLIINADPAFDLRVDFESISSTASNRFAGFGTSRKIMARDVAFAVYDGTSSRWRLLVYPQ